MKTIRYQIYNICKCKKWQQQNTDWREYTHKVIIHDVSISPPRLVFWTA